MDRKKEFGSFRDPTGHVVYISLIPVIDIAKHGRSAHSHYGTSCRVKRIARGDNFVAWSYSKRLLSDRINASVPLFVMTQCRAPTYSANSRSNVSMNDPSVNSAL